MVITKIFNIKKNTKQLKLFNNTEFEHNHDHICQQLTTCSTDSRTFFIHFILD